MQAAGFSSSERTFAHKVLFPQGLPAIIREAMMAREAGSSDELRCEFCFRSMTAADTQSIAAWKYTDEYSFYDLTSDPYDLAELLDPVARADEYVAVDSSEGLIGFFQYKRPHGTSLAIGLGLHPSWTGRGLGRRFLEAGLDYGRRRFAPEQFTLRSPASIVVRSRSTSEPASSPFVSSTT